MAIEPDRTQFTDRKVVRRGLLAGLAGFGAAAALKVTGAGKPSRAEATDGQSLKIGNVLIDGFAQTAQSITTINCNPAFDNFGLLVVNGTVTGAPGRTGVGGTSNSQSGAGIFGSNSAAGGAGVWGDGSPGVLGRGLVANSTGVRGITADAGGIGIQGIANAPADFTTNGNGAGTGVLGKSGSGPGVRGESNSGAGVFGKSTSQPGVDGVSTSSLGVRGVSTNFVGVVGISSGSHGLYGSSGAAAGIGLVGENTAGGLAGYFFGNVQIVGALQVFGAKNAVIKMQDGTNAAVYCQESPEPYFEDFGRGQLAGGVANVQLEREFRSRCR